MGMIKEELERISALPGLGVVSKDRASTAGLGRAE